MRHFATSMIAVVLLSSSCDRATTPNDDEEALARLRQSLPAGEHHAGTWHFEFETVRAYRLNWSDEQNMEGILANDGKLNANRNPLNGIPLSRAQVARLAAAITGTHPDHPRAACIYPHHAFLFFDGEGNVVGNVDVCLLCVNYQGKPSGYARNWDLISIARLLQELGLPLRNRDWN